MKDSRWIVCCLCVCLFAPLSVAVRRTIGENGDIEEPLEDSGDVIMKEDAEEVFYNMDLAKYKGIRCPEAIPPDHGSIVGGENPRVGSVAYVQCQTGYRLEGPTVMACVPVNGGAHWDPEPQSTCVEDNSNFPENEPEPEKTVISRSLPEEPIRLDEDMSPPFIDPRTHFSWRRQARENALYKRNFAEDEEPDTISPEEADKIPSICLDRPVPGPCKAFFRRYFFDKSTMECRRFIFGGCGGNGNNFETQTECDQTCLGIEG